MKEIENDTKIWKVVSCSWIVRINIVKTSLLPKAIYIFNEIAIKPFFTNEPMALTSFGLIVLILAFIVCGSNFNYFDEKLSK